MSLFPESDHIESCPFCGEAFDMRELGQVLEHYQHQIEAGAPPAVEIEPGDIVEDHPDGTWSVHHPDGSVDVYPA